MFIIYPTSNSVWNTGKCKDYKLFGLYYNAAPWHCMFRRNLPSSGVESVLNVVRLISTPEDAHLGRNMYCTFAIRIIRVKNKATR
jgi:hypothetical protein